MAYFQSLSRTTSKNYLDILCAVEYDLHNIASTEVPLFKTTHVHVPLEQTASLKWTHTSIYTYYHFLLDDGVVR